MPESETTDALRRKIEAELMTIEAAMSDAIGDSLELDQTKVGRLSRMDAIQQQAVAEGMKERLLLRGRRLQAALQRLENDEFGLCCACGQDIPEPRLQADIATPFCAGCQEEIDGRRR